MITGANKDIRKKESKKRREIKERTITLVELLLTEKISIREMVKRTGIKKSTIHKDFLYNVPRFYPHLWEAVEQQLEDNYYNGVSKGGQLTWERYRAKGLMQWLDEKHKGEEITIEPTGANGQFTFLF